MKKASSTLNWQLMLSSVTGNVGVCPVEVDCRGFVGTRLFKVVGSPMASHQIPLQCFQNRLVLGSISRRETSPGSQNNSYNNRMSRAMPNVASEASCGVEGLSIETPMKGGSPPDDPNDALASYLPWHPFEKPLLA